VRPPPPLPFPLMPFLSVLLRTIRFLGERRLGVVVPLFAVTSPVTSSLTTTSEAKAPPVSGGLEPAGVGRFEVFGGESGGL
jgi:hypothetical protein